MKLKDLKPGLFKYQNKTYLKTRFVTQTDINSTDKETMWPYCYTLQGEWFAPVSSVYDMNNLDVESTSL